MAKTDEQRGPVAAWARRERMARGWTQQDVASRLGISEPSYRGYEAGPRVSVPVRKALEALYGTKAPDRIDKSPDASEMAELVTALREQTAALNRLADALTSSTPALTIPDQVAMSLAERFGLLLPPHDEEPPEAGAGHQGTADTGRLRTA